MGSVASTVGAKVIQIFTECISSPEFFCFVYFSHTILRIAILATTYLLQNVIFV